MFRPGVDITLENRNFAYLEVDKKKRYGQILEILSSGVAMTAKEIAQEMYLKGYIPTNERNFTSPRLNELAKEGKVEPYGKKKCQWTNKMVTVFKIRRDQLDGGM